MHVYNGLNSYFVILLFVIDKRCTIEELYSFQQDKRQDESAMATSYTHLPLVLAHIYGTIF